MTSKKSKPVAKEKSAGKTNKISGSIVKCEVNLEKGEWISPDSCKTFYIDENATFPDIAYEIKTDAPGPYEWSWKIKFTGLACPQSDGKSRFTPKGKPIEFNEHGDFKSDSKVWKANLKGNVIGGDLTVTVKAGTTTFVRKTIILGKNPSKAEVQLFLDSNWNNADDIVIIKKIFQQESHYRQFYSDEMPLISFDNGYGIGQITNPLPTYVVAWNWKEHVKTVMNIFLPDKRERAKTYLGKHGKSSYTKEQYDIETTAFYNGAGRYHIWKSKENKWVEDNTTICDPESNRSWIKLENPGKTAKELLKNGTKPEYTGHCYAKHINESKK